ncbi:MAG: KamA family radical SAM protein, partial [Deltaproteobacteria bacterium]
MDKESYGLQREDKVLTGGKTKKADIAPGESSGPEINLEEILQLGREDLTRLLWSADRQIHKILRASSTIEEARNRLFKYFDTLERSYFNIYSTKKFKDLHDLKKRHAKWCIKVLKNIIRTEHEELTGSSALESLWKLAHPRSQKAPQVSESFLCELVFLFFGINGKFPFQPEEPPSPPFSGPYLSPGVARSRLLDNYAERIKGYLSRYPNGLDPEVIEKGRFMVRKIMAYFGGTPAEWKDYKWHLKNIIRKKSTIENLVELSEAERKGLEMAEAHRVPFQITPYYLSLFDPHSDSGRDAIVRAQVLPSKQYVQSVVEARQTGKSLDFMGENSTSPIKGITRRYIQVLILKAFDSCPQICVYCQRNWELKGLCQTRVERNTLQKAIEWIAANRNIEDVLITGGDPLTLDDNFMAWILERLGRIDHLQRIRISTRVPVTIPFRITEKLIDLVSSYHKLGSREICFVTHFESPLEMTPDALAAIQRIRNAGLSIYNQQVFTFFNSRRFETF